MMWLNLRCWVTSPTVEATLYFTRWLGGLFLVVSAAVTVPLLWGW